MILILGVSAGIAGAQERLWTGVSGKSFRGTLHKVAEDGKNAEFLSPDGKMLRVAISHLIGTDQKHVLNPAVPPSAEATARAGDSAAFKPSASPNRLMLPTLDPKEFAATGGEGMVDALWISLLWWDQTGVLEVPKKGDLARKGKWLHNRLTRGVSSTTRGSVSAEEAKASIEDYFLKDLKEIATCRVFVESHDFSPQRLAHLVQGPNSVILSMTMIFGSGRDYSPAAVLESMTEDGKFVVHLYGRRFTGRLVSQSQGDAKERAGYEYVLDNPQNLPAHYITNEAKYYMGNRPWNAAIVFKPYVYLNPGKPASLPPDDAFPVEVTSAAVATPAP